MYNFYKKLSKIGWVNTLAHQGIRLYKELRIPFIQFNYDAANNPTIHKQTLVSYNKHRKFTTSKVLCFAPQRSMLFSFDGNVYVCCENKQYSIGNITKQPVKDIWFGEKRYYIDQTINQDYNLGVGCGSCQKKIAAGDYSLALSQTFDIYTTGKPGYPTRLDFEIHNTCNLECIMCGGIYSSSIQANRYKLPALANVYGAEFIEQLREFIPHVQYINLIGGEPTLIKLYYEIIELVIATNPKCIIHLQTNASHLPDRFKDLLTRGNFQIGISIDALNKATTERIRKNIKFEVFWKNIQYYLQLHHTNDIKLTINTCPMPENWEDIIPIIKFCNEHQLPVFFCIVNAPYYYSFISRDIPFVDMVLESLQRSLSGLPKRNYYERNNYERLKDFLHQLSEWKVLIAAQEEANVKMAAFTIEQLYHQYTTQLKKHLIISDKEAIIEAIIEFAKQSFSALPEADIRRFLLVLINAVQQPIHPPSKEEQLKWGKEYIRTLIFSYYECSTVKA